MKKMISFFGIVILFTSLNFAQNATDISMWAGKNVTDGQFFPVAWVMHNRPSSTIEVRYGFDGQKVMSLLAGPAFGEFGPGKWWFSPVAGLNVGGMDGFMFSSHLIGNESIFYLYSLSQTQAPFNNVEITPAVNGTPAVYENKQISIYHWTEILIQPVKWVRIGPMEQINWSKGEDPVIDLGMAVKFMSKVKDIPVYAKVLLWNPWFINQDRFTVMGGVGFNLSH
ncbi:MAG: hypothetical protein OEX08_03265 [Candidatus Nomurabacteria bacterium]|nr:hypothetical protein [Candidatus Nomurabacteria bacterium]